MERLSKREAELAARLIAASYNASKDSTEGLLTLVDELTHEKINQAMHDQALAVLHRHGFKQLPSYEQIIEYVRCGHRP